MKKKKKRERESEREQPSPTTCAREQHLIPHHALPSAATHTAWSPLGLNQHLI